MKKVLVIIGIIVVVLAIIVVFSVSKVWQVKRIDTSASELANNTSEEITEEQAIEVVEDYRINNLQDTTNSYKFQKIEKETVEIKSTYSAVNGNYVINVENYSKEVYAVYYSLDDNSDRFIGYVDIDTGDLLGFHGEGV